MIYEQTKYNTFYNVQADQDPVLLGKVLRDHVIVKASNTSLTPGLLNIISLERWRFELWHQPPAESVLFAVDSCIQSLTDGKTWSSPWQC